MLSRDRQSTCDLTSFKKVKLLSSSSTDRVYLVKSDWHCQRNENIRLKLDLSPEEALPAHLKLPELFALKVIDKTALTR